MGGAGSGCPRQLSQPRYDERRRPLRSLLCSCYVLNSHFRRLGSEIMRSPSSALFWLLTTPPAATVLKLPREGQPRAPHDLRPLNGAPVTGRARVVDGDSLEVAGYRIRLFGIDAPEWRQECTDASGASYACGRAAARALYV